MPKVPKIVPVSDLRKDAAAVLKKLQTTEDPLVITQRGRAAAVLVSLKAYEKSQDELELLRLLVRGEKEIAQGKGYSLASVMEEAELLLEEEES